MSKHGVVWASGIATGIAVLALLLLAVAATTRGTAAGTTSLSAASASHHDGGARIVFIGAHSDAFGAYEQRLERASRTVPTATILGASFTAGVGPDNSSLSWSVLLARKLGWNAVIYGDPGAGYVSTGAGHDGPALHMLARTGLRSLHPSLVVLQFGHDDIGVPTMVQQLAVKRTISTIRAEDPRARLALVTVFTEPGSQAGARRTDGAIVSAAKAADPNAIIIDPLAGHWVYQRAHHGLHPTAAGDRWIAQKVYAALRADGIRSARSSNGAMICDSAVGVSDHGRTVLAADSRHYGHHGIGRHRRVRRKGSRCPTGALPAASLIDRDGSRCHIDRLAKGVDDA